MYLISTHTKYKMDPTVQVDLGTVYTDLTAPQKVPQMAPGRLGSLEIRNAAFWTVVPGGIGYSPVQRDGSNPPPPGGPSPHPL